MRHALCVSYEGTQFKGWQTQINQRTVQTELELAISKVADEPVKVVTAGRTDTAVHATGQVVHFDSTASRSLEAWKLGVNRFLPDDIRVIWSANVDNDFHARFSALRRSYRYIIYNNPVKSALFRNHVTACYRPLDVGLMKQAAVHFIGKMDFSTVRAAGCQAKTAIRQIDHLEIYSSGPWVWFDVTANAFLQHMVRNIAGMLIEVGVEERKPNWVKEVLLLKDRTKAGVTALPNGLYLTNIEYDSKFELPESPPQISFWSEYK